MLPVHVGAPSAGETVELRFSARVADPPFGRKKLAILQPVKGWLERSLRDSDDVTRDLLQALGDGVAMQRAEGQHFENQKIEGSLRQVGFGCRHDALSFDIFLDHMSKVKAWHVASEEARASLPHTSALLGEPDVRQVEPCRRRLRQLEALRMAA